MADLKEGEILELIRKGRDKDVIPLLYKKVLPQLKSYIAKNKGNREDAYDIFHDALMLFYQQVIDNEFNEKYNIYGYLYKISVFRWINKIKKDRNMLLVEDIPEAISEDLTSRFDSEDATRDKNILKTLFEQLGGKCVELLNYTIYSDMLMEDVAIRMGFTSVDAVRMQQMRCKQKLIKELENNPLLLKRLKGQ